MRRKRVFREKLGRAIASLQLSAERGWWYTLGTLLLFLFIAQVITGILMYDSYSPTVEFAYDSVALIQWMDGGWLIRGIHYWGATVMLIVSFIHIMRVYFRAEYKHPHEFAWIAGIILIGLTFSMALSGYILPWSDRSYWAATILAACLDYIPWIGTSLIQFVGGRHAGDETLAFYATVHMYILPILMGGMILIHLLLIRKRGAEDVPVRNSAGNGFFSFQINRDGAVVLLVLLMLVLLSRYIGVPMDKRAAPLAEVNAVPKPEWFILFGYEILKMFKGKWIVIVITVVPAVGALLALFLPFYDRSDERVPLRRPLAVAAGVALLVIIGYLTLIAHISTPLPGRIFAPHRNLSLQELAGMALFEKNLCYSCHSILGNGMKNAPDLWKVGAKHDSDYLKKLLKDPDKVLGKGKMIKYHVDEKDRDALISYLLSLNFIRFKEQIIAAPYVRAAYLLYRQERDILTMVKEPTLASDERVERISLILSEHRSRLTAKGEEISDTRIDEIVQYLLSIMEESSDER